jgi:hypothetical protein
MLANDPCREALDVSLHPQDTRSKALLLRHDLSVYDTGSPRASASGRTPSSVQGSPDPCLPAHPKAPEERTRELGGMTADRAHHACALERTRPCEY